MRMRHAYLSIAILGAAASATWPAAAGEPDRSPTGNITQRPRTVDELGFGRTNQQDSVLAGGTTWAPPPIVLENPCIANPALCEEPPVGEPPPPPPLIGIAGTCGFSSGAPYGTSVGMTVNRAGGHATCVQGGGYVSTSSIRPSPISRFDVQATFSVAEYQYLADLGNPAIWRITWSGDCAGSSGVTCTTSPVRVTLVQPQGMNDEDAAWEAGATLLHLPTGQTYGRSFMASYNVCGVSGRFQLECL